MFSIKLRKSDHTEKPMQASKWLSQAILVDANEMASLFDFLGDFYIFLVSSVVDENQGEVAKEEFLKTYSQYIEELKSGLVPNEKNYRHFFSSVFTATGEHLYALPLEDDKQLIRIAKPVVQLQSHKIGYSSADEKFRSGSYGSDAISWGLQFSYPQLYQDNKTHEVFQVKNNAQFPNTELFQKIQKWVRNNTVPTPFLINEKQLNVPMRLGKQCFGWINSHPQLIEKGIMITKLALPHNIPEPN